MERWSDGGEDGSRIGSQPADAPVEEPGAFQPADYRKPPV
jgi:hypothetical protein